MAEAEVSRDNVLDELTDPKTESNHLVNNNHLIVKNYFRKFSVCVVVFGIILPACKFGL